MLPLRKKRGRQNMTVDVSTWQMAIWNFVVLAVAGVATMLIGVEPLIAG